MTETLPIAHLAATWFMVGLIWVIQVVHYPLWVHVADSQGRALHRRHARRIGSLVMTVGVIEMMASALMVALRPGPLTLAGALLLLLIWTSTIFVQMPLHRRFSQAWSSELIAPLVRGNWPRTILWTMRGTVAIVVCLP
jgi:hypothetical protein